MSIIFSLYICIAIAFPENINYPQSFSWLPGVWEMKLADGNARLEIWNAKNDFELNGIGVKVSGKDTIHLESIRLILSDDQFYYIPTVPDQNQSMPVSFKLVQTQDLKFIFENPDHDFPQRIVYHMKPMRRYPEVVSSPGDTLQVRVERLDGDGLDFLFFRK